MGEVTLSLHDGMPNNLYRSTVSLNSFMTYDLLLLLLGTIIRVLVLHHHYIKPFLSLVEIKPQGLHLSEIMHPRSSFIFYYGNVNSQKFCLNKRNTETAQIKHVHEHMWCCYFLSLHILIKFVVKFPPL